jgi:uncharacterized protein YdaU (DUF1376 family)
MVKRPSFQFYPADWLSDPNVIAMTAEQRGGYIQLLASMWTTEDCELLNDEEYLCRISGLEQVGVKMVLRCFKVSDTNPGNITHKRLLLERKKQDDWHKKSSKAGKKGADKRWPQRAKQQVGVKMVNTKQHSSTSTSTSTSVKEIYMSVLESFNSLTGKNFRMTPEKEKQLSARLKRFKQEELEQAIRNRLDDPSSMGKNKDGRIWAHDWDSLFRNDTNVDRALNLAGSVVKDDAFYVVELNRLKMHKFRAKYGDLLFAKYSDYYQPNT